MEKEKTRQSLIPNVYFVVLCISVFYIICALTLEVSRGYNRAESMTTRELEPISRRLLDEDTIEYVFEIPSGDGISNTLMFYVNHQYVTVTADGREIYSVSETRSLYGRSPGSFYNFVELPTNIDKVKVTIRSVYKNGRDRDYTFYYGDGIKMQKDLLAKSVASVTFSLISILLGLGMLIYWLLFHKKTTQDSSIFYFGMAVIVVGFWCINETDAATILLTNRTAASFAGFVLLSLIPVPFTLFVSEYLELKNKIIRDGICGITFAVGIVTTFLHISGVKEFKETVFFIHFALVLSLLYFMCGIIVHYKRSGMDRHVRLNIVSLVVLASSAIVDILAYYAGSAHTDVFGRFGILVYVVIIGSESITIAENAIEAGKKSEMYESLASTDVMTNLYNRRAFENWESNLPENSKVMLIVFDLNDLKKINDTKGHNIGDRYIKDSASLIQEIFGELGPCYRIGGDEFCTVIVNPRNIDVEKYISMLRTAEDTYNMMAADFEIQIAVGYATTGEFDVNVEYTRDRADAAMYANKKELKNNL